MLTKQTCETFAHLIPRSHTRPCLRRRRKGWNLKCRLHLIIERFAWKTIPTREWPVNPKQFQPSLRLAYRHACNWLIHHANANPFEIKGRCENRVEKVANVAGSGFRNVTGIHLPTAVEPSGLSKMYCVVASITDGFFPTNSKFQDRRMSLSVGKRSTLFAYKLETRRQNAWLPNPAVTSSIVPEIQRKVSKKSNVRFPMDYINL